MKVLKVPSVKVQALLAFIFVQQWVSIVEGQSTGSGTLSWTPFTCDRENNADLFTIKIGDCNILQSENGLPCSMDLIERMVLQRLCFSNGVDSYVCNVNSNYTGDPPCCVSHFIDDRTSNSCESMDTTSSSRSTTEPVASTQSTTPTQGTTEPGVPIVIKFQLNEYDVTEGSDAQVCLVITNGTVITGITIDVHLDPSTDTCREVYFPEGATVGDHQCTTFPNTSLQVGLYRVRAQVLTQLENSSIVNTTDSSTLIIHKRELSGLEIGFIVVLAVVLVVVLAAVLGGSCGAAARRIVRQRVHMDDAVNLPVPDPQDERELEMPDAQDEWEVPPGEADTLPYYSSPVQERARGGRAPSSATHRGSQNNVHQSGVQPEILPIFANQMGTPEENGNSNANPHHVCVELDTPHHSHGTQPKDGSSMSGRLVYTQPMNNKPLVECGTGVVVYGASQASSLDSSDEAMQLTA